MNNEFDLKDCLSFFDDVGNRRFGGVIDFPFLEERFALVKTGREKLTSAHLELLKEDLAFNKWWKIPDLSNDDYEKIQKATIELGQLDKAAIYAIYDSIKHIEIVSCLLRLVDPVNYAIISPPVESLVGVQGDSDASRYMNYLKDLSELKEYYTLEKTSDVDQALWTLANILNDQTLRFISEEYRNIYKTYTSSINKIKIVKARNLLKPILDNRTSYLDFAIMFLESDCELAGILAGKELEQIIKLLCQENKIKLKWAGKPEKYKKFHELVDELLDRRIIKPSDKDSLAQWWDTRNQAVHESNLFKDPSDLTGLRLRIKEMIDGLKKLRSVLWPSGRQEQ